jgi:hypothetical protein
MRKFHRDVWLPERLLACVPRNAFAVTYTEHARQRALPRPDRIDPGRMTIIELQSKRNWRVDRALYRENDSGVCYVVSFARTQASASDCGGVASATVITVYRNHVDDQHATLERGAYVQHPAQRL